MKLHKRAGLVLLTLTLSVNTMFSGFQVKAETVETSRILELKDENTIVENYENLNDISMMYTSAKVYEKLDIDEVREVIDNGTDLLVNGIAVEELEEDFSSELIAEEEDGYKVIGGYVTTQGTGYSVTPIYAGLVYEEGKSVSEEQHMKDLEGLAENAVIDADECYAMLNSSETEDDFLEQISDEELGRLQVSTLIGESFADKNKFVYFYKKGAVNGTGTDYEYSSSTSKEGYSKLGSLNMTLYIIKRKTSGTATYDNLYGVVTASGLNDKAVINYDVGISVSPYETNQILDETDGLGTADNSVSGSVATGISADGISFERVTEYRYNPDAQNIKDVFGERYDKKWKCTTGGVTNNNLNRSWKIRPGVFFKKTNGTTTPVYGRLYVDYFRVGGGVRVYTMKEKVTVAIKFQNHKVVS